MIRCYKIPSDEHGSWAKIIIDDSGYFSTVSDYGNYAFQWTHFGEGTDFRDFLMGLNADYLMSKLHLGRPMEFDDEDLRKWCQGRIKKYRREKLLSSEDAHELWDSLDTLTTELEFMDFFREAWKVSDELFYDYWEKGSHRYPYDLQGFANKLWPRFTAMLKDERAKELVA